MRKSALSSLLLRTFFTREDPSQTPYPPASIDTVNNETGKRDDNNAFESRANHGDSIPTSKYQDMQSDDPLEFQTNFGQGEHDIISKEETLEALVQQALQRGFPRRLEQDFRNLIQQYQDIFEIKLGADAPAHVPPMRIRRIESVQLMKVKSRNFTPPQREFLKKNWMNRYSSSSYMKTMRAAGRQHQLLY